MYGWLFSKALLTSLSAPGDVCRSNTCAVELLNIGEVVWASVESGNMAMQIKPILLKKHSNPRNGDGREMCNWRAATTNMIEVQLYWCCEVKGPIAPVQYSGLEIRGEFSLKDCGDIHIK